VGLCELRTAWSTEQGQGHPELHKLHSEPLSQNKQTKNNKKKKKQKKKNKKQKKKKQKTNKPKTK
jgi:hypothetical protein